MIEPRHIETAPGLVFGATVVGPEAAPLALMLHGFCVSRHFWENQIPARAAAGHFVVAPNQRGYAAGARPHRSVQLRSLRLRARHGPLQPPTGSAWWTVGPRKIARRLDVDS